MAYRYGVQAEWRAPPMTKKTENETLFPGEAAEILGVSVKTLTRYADAGLVPYTKTLGGHRRFKRSVVERISIKGGRR